MRTRLRPPHDAGTLAAMYAVPHRHDQWEDHIVRVDETIRAGRELFRYAGYPDIIADLSCGDATIARNLALARPGTGPLPAMSPSRLILGDLAPGYGLQGPIEQTLRHLPRADLLICTETVEHLDDPDAVLALARGKAGALLLSTPLAELPGINAEHYWSWDHDGVRAMLDGAGWVPVLQRDASWTDGNGWTWAYQIWGCR